MAVIRAVTVYCSSSSHVDSIYMETAAALGKAIAAEGWQLVYGGNRIGMMGALADAVRGSGGKVVGITPQLLVDKGLGDDRCEELIVTAGMRERKELLEQRGDGFIALPGGLGTLEELFEIIVGRVLGYHSKPIVLMNVEGFYDPLLAMIERGIHQKFIRAKSRALFSVATGVAEAILLVRAFHAGPAGPAQTPASVVE